MCYFFPVLHLIFSFISSALDDLFIFLSQDGNMINGFSKKYATDAFSIVLAVVTLFFIILAYNQKSSNRVACCLLRSLAYFFTVLIGLLLSFIVFHAITALPANELKIWEFFLFSFFAISELYYIYEFTIKRGLNWKRLP